jgi:hypothetical protein
MSMIRTRWAAVGAAVAITLGAGGIGLVDATSPSGASTFVPITPCRLADTRPSTIGADSTMTFEGWGNSGDCSIPNGTTGLALNVTAIGATQQTNLRFHPTGTPTPATANLNPTPGAPPTPNAVNVTLNATNGRFDVYNRFGNVAVIIDAMGYYTDHHHDDRYYTETEVDTALSAKANAADVYKKVEIEDVVIDVLRDSGALGAVEIFTEELTLALNSDLTGANGQATAECRDGLVAISGGISNPFHEGLNIRASRPEPADSLDPTGWFVDLRTANGTAAGSTATVYAICIQLIG